MKHFPKQPYNYCQITKNNNMETIINYPTNQAIYNKLINSPLNDESKKFLEAVKAASEEQLFQDFLAMAVSCQKYVASQKPAATEFAPSIYNVFEMMDVLAETPALSAYPKYIQAIVFVLVPDLKPFALAWSE